ncbi:hypothetical protein GS398_08295 [Pedobacter sp. HMF7056]|uniref:CBU-0592-like domain-containing protein n=1 Tax=Hufsiella ginkgonis TaxID=2695274 RepID=A0A7K1XX56_9SPHI|nr:hypothetical protein [Hufsiella ginkgonis]MXV15299.1 hypothetical protein [Hufsiella ginkgonis]
MKVIQAESRVFQSLNIVGGFCLAFTAFDTHDLPNVTANLFWMFIGIYALGRQLRTRNRAGNS